MQWLCLIGIVGRTSGLAQSTKKNEIINKSRMARLKKTELPKNLGQSIGELKTKTAGA